MNGVPFRQMVKPALRAGLAVSLLVAAGTTTNYLLAGGSNPSRVLQFVASGLFGEEAFHQPAGSFPFMAILGAVLHILVSIAWSVILFVVSWKAPRFTGSWPLLGLAFGMAIWAVMVFVVMPLSRTPSLKLGLTSALIDIVILTLGAGLPIAFLARRFRITNAVEARRDVL